MCAEWGNPYVEVVVGRGLEQEGLGTEFQTLWKRGKFPIKHPHRPLLQFSSIPLFRSIYRQFSNSRIFELHRERLEVRFNNSVQVSRFIQYALGNNINKVWALAPVSLPNVRSLAKNGGLRAKCLLPIGCEEKTQADSGTLLLFDWLYSHDFLISVLSSSL